jgi:hypothetical protein
MIPKTVLCHSFVFVDLESWSGTKSLLDLPVHQELRADEASCHGYGGVSDVHKRSERPIGDRGKKTYPFWDQDRRKDPLFRLPCQE